MWKVFITDQNQEASFTESTKKLRLVVEKCIESFEVLVTGN